MVVQNSETLVKLGSLVRSGPYNAQAAFAVVVAIDKSARFGISDASRAIQSMVLAAWSEGVSSHWTGWVGMAEVASPLGIPDSYGVIAVLPYGYATRVRTMGRKRRKDLSEIASRECFDQPFN